MEFDFIKKFCYTYNIKDWRNKEMAINITAPLSGYVDRNSTITLSWTNTDSNYDGH